MHYGIVVCSFDPDFARQGERVDAIVTAEPDLRNRLLRVNNLRLQ
jgi:hypothetical protein